MDTWQFSRGEGEPPCGFSSLSCPIWVLGPQQASKLFKQLKDSQEDNVAPESRIRPVVADGF